MIPRHLSIHLCSQPQISSNFQNPTCPSQIFFFFEIHLVFSPSWFSSSLGFAEKNGRLGSCGDSSGSVCGIDTGAFVSDTGKGKSGGVWEHADQWRFYCGSCHHLLWPHHHLPHCHRCSHLCWLINYIVLQLSLEFAHL
ncbi:unnamed protein product, partial [Prunus brigantina]